MSGACACIGPVGDCPCIRLARGEKLKITETYIAPDIFDMLSDEDKETINTIKQKAFFAWFTAEKQKKQDASQTTP